jgi:alpha-galactosidase
MPQTHACQTIWSRWALLASTLLGGFMVTTAAEPLPFHAWAKTPPMGWNSWDCYGAGVWESNVVANADYMARHLKPHGWEVVTIDIQWYEPLAHTTEYRKGAVLETDSNGRLLPVPNRFPMTKQTRSFKPIADYLHGKGLRFGLHLMRGIPRQAVDRDNSPILGTSYKAADIADKKSTCSWNTDMYGVDVSKPGAQEYYDSVFALMASWDLDFIKVDDLSRPYHKAEIEAIRKAIDKTGRAIVLSISPGATPLNEGEHVQNHANMWRVSDDFWDDWGALYAQFQRLKDWTPFRGTGHWPDADMLPLGNVRAWQEKDAWTRFSPDEQFTLMTLWSIARSPLIIGGNMPRNDNFTLSLLTNDEIIAVNQDSAGNRELFEREGFRGWLADVPGSTDKYLALFNTRPLPGQLDPSRAVFQSAPINRRTSGQGVKLDVDLAGARKLFLVVDDTRSGNGGDNIVWSEPTLISAAGSQKLTELKWVNASSGGNTQVSTEHSANGKEMLLAGKPPRFGIAAHAKSVIEFDLPAGTTRFQCFAGIDDEGAPPPRGPFGGPAVRFSVFTQSPFATDAAAAIPLKLSEIGFAAVARARDLWQHKDLGAVSDEFAPVIKAHGAGLYRLSAGK